MTINEARVLAKTVKALIELLLNLQIKCQKNLSIRRKSITWCYEAGVMLSPKNQENYQSAERFTKPLEI